MAESNVGVANATSVPFKIRPFEPGDAQALAAVFMASVHGIAGVCYSADQIRAWCPEEPPAEAMRLKLSDGRKVWVAVETEGVPVAFVDLESDGHIDMLFCHPRAAGQGAATALFSRLEAAAREQNIKTLFVEASEAARRFFERRGFVVKERQDFCRRGVQIHNYRMVKHLAVV